MKLPSLEGVEAAARDIAAYLAPSPLVRSDVLSNALGADVWLKNETVSPVSSFKLRGALTELLRASRQAAVVGAVTSSTGNHGQGVAYAARLLGIPADIFLPEDPNPVKKAMIRAFGATIHESGRDIDEAKAVAREFATRKGRVFVDDGEGLGVMEGAGTVGLELARALEHVDRVYIPMGSGSLAAGSAAAVKAIHPRARVVAVQAKGSPAMVESFHARRPLERPVQTIADGLVCREPAALALAALLETVDDALLTDDALLLAMVHTLAATAHILVEPSGAAAVAGAWLQRDQLCGERVVLVLTGANITMNLLHDALAEEPVLKL